MKARFIILIGSSALAFLFAGYSAYQLQITQGDFYVNKVRAQMMLSDALTSPRGDIFLQDKSGRRVPAAIIKEFPTIYAVPDKIVDAKLAAQQLAEVLPIPEETLFDLLSKRNDPYEIILQKAESQQVAAVKNLEIEGVEVKEEKFRAYPFKELASQVLGFVGLSNADDGLKGRAGIEQSLDSILTGSEDESGGDVTLTIDRAIQARAETILKNLIEEYNAEGGSVIVEDPFSGKILAMGNYPTFDPNNYSKEHPSVFKNTAVQDVYEPGSVVKLLTVAAGIDSGKITPETVYHDTGSITLNNRTIHNWDLKAHGDITMTEAIEGSINTAMVFAENKMGHDIFYDYLVKFGFKEPTNISLPAEGVGKLTPLEKNKQDINFATAAYGQGISVTPIRLITAVSAIANGGKLISPTIVEGEVPREVLQVISPETAKKVTAMMVSSVKKNVLAAIPRYDVAGKTGTAQVPDFENGGYLSFDEAVINTYVGFAPAAKPRFTILIKLNMPEGAPPAGRTVVPAFKELAEFLLNYFNVPPTN